jgi:hypothetical protein
MVSLGGGAKPPASAPSMAPKRAGSAAVNNGVFVMMGSRFDLATARIPLGPLQRPYEL